MNRLESALEELYSADPAGFTEKRDALARQLKADGDKKGAAAVKARRKPTQIAWILNQLARREADAIADLVDVGKELAREQRRALRGDATGGLRDSIDRQRKTITALAQKTAALMKELGVDPSAHQGELTTALQAALVDPVVGAQLEEGRFEKAPEAASGFGGPIPDDVAPAKAKSPPARKKHDEAAEKAEAARKKALAEHAKAVTAAKAELKEADSAAKRARHTADEAEKEAKAAIERAKRLASTADEKEEMAAAAEKALSKLEANAPA